ncbi:A disintegrin and metalloproteinase with thrombospondin motifs 15a [Gadus chalcogrammus]|uniref:A disintegrin and metalloproteinase with thrombospondin motifs 15a n=1 Tax=Gadus chalcogrammus TaxID=1042646 RepID=UPI0024C38DA5|nr:A disintegrin and metalloproteinase with thrombospondin motifs 15a [Gadus chalcogrammus]
MFPRTAFLLCAYSVAAFFRDVHGVDREVVFPVRLGVQNDPRGGSEERCVVKIRAFQQELVLDLQRDSSFLAPSVVSAQDTVLVSTDVTPELSRCFYSGYVNKDQYSYAALSLCRGVHGAFGYQGWEYFISPLRNDSANDLESAHSVRRRVASSNSLRGANSTASRCAVETEISAEGAQSLEKYKNLKAKHNVTEGMLKRLGRAKRFASIPRYVETLVVADESMVEFHGDDLKHYLLTLMSVAARLYKHPSIQNSISIVVVKFVMINEADKGPKVSGNAAMTLRNFCTWQKKMNKNNDKHSDYWDTAILFTREDLCGASTCDTLGMADVGTMCDPKRSCSVIEDDGLPSAFTTAHELGHVLNMLHDNVKACEEAFGRLQDNHMMSPTLIQINRTSPWSPCSAAILTDFLDSGHGECLLDQPQKPLALPNGLPGSTYGLERQCELAFGEGSKPCPFMQPPCGRLWCTGKTNGQLVCQTRHFPWADGTGCGDGRVCIRGVCSDKQQVHTVRVDGRWGRWGLFGSCSRTCGGGVQLSKRDCSNPIPSNGGKYCQGVRVKYRSCNLNPCPDTGKSYRDEQCAAFNGFSLNTNRRTPSVVWVPKYSGVSPKDTCKLICKANGTGYFNVLSPKVVDGTPCSPDSPGVCVLGKCIKAGCDGKLGSSKKFNKCGVCGGDNKSCKKVSGLFTKPINGYNFVVLLPVGAANVDVRQRGYKGMVSDDNYLAVKSSRGDYLLNGNYVVSAVESDIFVRNSLVRYSGTSGLSETLQAVKPLGEALTVEVLSVGKMTPPRIRYSFYLARQVKEDKSLRTEGRSPNSVLPEEGGKAVGEDHLKGASYSKTGPVQAKWLSGSWAACSSSCEGGTQRRLVQCLKPDGRPGADCEAGQRPAASRACGELCPVWTIGDWSLCSRTCGKGFKRRSLRCVSAGKKLLTRDHCSGARKPQELDFCNLAPC